mgnify:CR=1 FL=1
MSARTAINIKHKTLTVTLLLAACLSNGGHILAQGKHDRNKSKSGTEQTSGKKATEWICDFVIMEAQSLLRYSGLSVHEISERLNFPSQSAFGKYFKYQVGVSPSDFLENNQESQ